MTKLIALVAVLALLVANSVAYMWYGFGLWPKSWWYVALFGVAGNTVGRMLLDAVTKSKD